MAGLKILMVGHGWVEGKHACTVEALSSLSNGECRSLVSPHFFLCIYDRL